MKKILIISLSAFVLTACTEKQKYEETVYEQIKNDPDVQSYHLDSEVVANCIVDISSKAMPGIILFDPRRSAAYKGYAKMISLKTSEKPEAVLAELRESFGSAQGLSDAHRNYSKSYLKCISTVTNRELDDNEGDEVEQEMIQ